MAMVSWLSWLLVIFATCGKVIGVEGDDFLDPFGEFDEFDPESFDDFDTFEGCGNRPMDIVLLVDTSEAYELNNQTYRTIRDFLVKFVKFTNVSSEGTRISLVTYSTSPLVHFRLGEINTPQGVQDAIMSARFMPGERNLADALDALRRRVFFEYYGDRPQVPDMVVLVTTGRSSRRVTQSFQYAQALKDIGVNVIGITWSEGGKQELSSVVSEPAYANLFSLDSISELHIMTELVVAQVCESSDDMDLVFLVHFSNELTSTNFAKITSFMADTVEGADVDLDSVRVGVAIYQAEGTVLFKLDAFRGDKSGLIDAIRDISPRYRSGDTNLAAGLNLVRTQMFDVNKGDRLDVPNGLVIITDANSDAQYYPELEYAAALVKDAGVTVFGVGIDLRNTDEMNLVSTNPQMSYVLGNVDQLPSMVQELRQKMPSLTFVLPEDIEPLPTTAAPTTVPTTEATTPAPTSVLESSREADIAVLFHVGHKTKLRDLNKKLKIYLSNVFAKSKVGPDTLRVALANYGTKPNVLFDFNAHTRKPQVRSAIKTTIKGNMRKSRANLGEALSTIRTDLLVPAAGSRIDQGVPTGLILVTDMAASNDGFDFEQEITSLKKMGVTVFGVGIGSSDVHDELRQLTSDPKSDYFQGVQSFSDLLATADPVKNIVNRVRAMGGKIKRRPTTTAPALSKYRKFQLVLVFRSDNTVSTADYYTHLLPFMARFLEEKFIQNIDIEIALISYGDSVNLVFGFQKIRNLTEMQTLILTAPDSLQSNYARFGDVLQYLDLRVFPQVTMDTSKHVVYIADRVYDNMNLKLKNGLLRLARKGIKYHWVLIGGQSNVSTPGDTYLVNDYPSLTHNYDVIDDITTDVSLDDSEYSEALVPKTSESGSLQNPPPTKILIVFRSGSSTSPPDYFTKLLPFISSFIDPNILSEANTDIAVVNYGKDINIVFGFQQLGFDEMRDAVSGISKKYRSKFSRFPLLIEYITQGMLVPPAVADTDDIHVIFIADQLYEKLNSGIRKGIEHLETRGIHTHWVMIGDNSAIPTTSVSYKVADYEELYSRQDITIQILAQITQGWSYTDDDKKVISTPRGPLEPPPEQDDERHVKVVIVFRTGSGTSPKDFYGNLLPFIESFLFETAAVPEVSMDFSVINYGKTVTRIIGFKEYDVEELHGIILGISKKYRSKFARFQDLLLYLQQSVFIPSNVDPDDEKHVIFITDKVYDNMDDSIESGIEDLETSGVMTHWVTIGTDQTIPTRGHVYSTQSYTGLSDYDVFAANFKILADIFTEPGARNHIVTMPTTISPSPTVPLLTTKRTRYAKIVIVFRSGSSTSPKDYFQQLLPFIDTFVNNVYTDQVEAEYSVINYGKTVSQIFGFKDYDPADLQTIILGMTKKYRSKFARFQELLQYLRQSVITQMSDEDEKHIIFITDKIYENMDDEASNALREIENGGVTTHWVLIGHNQDITTRGTKYHVGNYKELSDTSDIPIPYKILTDIQYNRETIHQERTTDRVTTTTAIRTTPQPGGAPDRTSTDPSLADIAFLFHASNTVPKKSFKKGYIKFLLRMIKKFKLEKGKVKTALATYGKNGQLLFNFDAFSQKKPAMKFIRKLPKNLRFKKADLAEGLRLVREEIFVAPFDRPEAPNYLIVLTDSPTDDGVAEVQIEADILKDMGVYVYLITVGDIGEETVIVPSEPSAAKQLSAYTDLANFKKSGKFLTKQIPALKLLKKKKGKGKKKKTTTIAPTSTITTLSTRQSTKTSDISVVTSTVTPVTDTTLDDRMSTDPTTATLPRLTTLMTSSQTSFTSITDAPVTDRTKMTPIDKAITTDAVFSTSGYKKSSEHVPVTKTRPTTIKSTRDVRKTKTTDPTTTQRTIEITDARTAGQTTTILNTVDITSTLGTARSTRSNEIPITQGPPRTTLLPKTTKVPFVSTRFSSASLPERVTSSNDAHTTRTSDMETTTSTQGNRVDEKQTTAATTTAEFTTVKDKASHTTKHHVSTTIAMSTDGFKEMQSVATTVWSRDVRTTLVNKVTTEDDATVAPVTLSVSEDADIIIAVHSSITATPSHFTMLLEFLAELYEQADIDGGRVKAGVMFYGSAATPIFYLDQFNSWDEVFMTISRTSNRLRSNVVDASRAMRRASDMFGAARGGRIPKALIMVTDAASNENIDSIPERKEALANQGVSIYSVGVGLPGKEELELLATASDNVFSVIGYEQLPRAAQDIKRRIRSLNTLPERVTDPPEINTSTGSPPAPVRTEAPTSDPGPIRVTFPTPDIGSCGLARVDIVFVIDSSTSVGVENFRKQINFVKQLLSNSDIDSGAVRAGALIYSTGVEVQFHLNDYTSKADMFAAIDDIQYIYGSTNTADGLRTMRQDMFTTANGDRPDVMNIAIVITDGVSNINSRRTIPEAESAHDDGIFIYTIGIGLLDTTELDAIATPPASSNSFVVDSFDELEGFEQKVYKSLCPEERTLPTRRPTTTAKPVTPIPTKPTTPIPTTRAPWTPPPTTTRGRTARPTYPPPTRRPPPTRYPTRRPPTRRPPPTRYPTRRPPTRRPPPTRYPTRRPPTRRPPPTRYPTRRPTESGRGTPLPTGRPRPTTMRPTRRPTESTLPPRRTPRPTTPRPTPRPTTPRPTTRKPTTPRPTTTTTPRPTRPAKAFDLVVVMDSSVRPEVFSKMTDYVKMVSGELSIDNEKFRMGLLRFSTYPDIQFQLGNYKSRKSVQRAIDRVQYRPGETNTAKAFDIVRTQMFKRRNGDRSFARNFILYLTGNDETENKFDSFAAAERAEDAGIQIFTVGFGLKDTAELNEISSHPLSDFQQLFLSEEGPRNLNDVLALLESMPDRPPKARRRPRPPVTTPRPRPEGPCSSTGDVIFILDTSGSVGRDNFYRMLNFTWSTVKELEVDSGNYRVGLMTFSDRANREFNLNRYTNKEDLKKAISRTTYIYGRTNTADAFLMARQDMFVQSYGDRPDVPNVIVVITDGESNINNMRTIPEAMTLKRAGVTIITVAVGYADSSAELFGITSNPVRDNLIKVANFDSLELLKDKLITPLCTDINLCLENPCHNGAFCIDGLRSYMCVCTEGYYGDNCQNTCGQSADVVFMLDSSTSIGQPTFQRMKTYAEELVRKMNIESCDIQVGVMKYSSASMVQFNIGTFRDTETVVRAIDSIHYTRGQANMASAFETVRTSMFNSGNDRPNVRNIAYLLTDGSVEVNADSTMQEAELAINSGIRIVPVGIDLRVKTDVENIANVQGGNTIEINGADGLRNGLADQVLRPVFEDESYCDTSPCSNGGQCRENGNGFVCECVPGYTGDTCEKRCDATADVVFVVDTSRYVSRKELRSVKRFIRSLVKRMQFKRHRFRAGIVSFAKYSRVKLTLSQTTKKKSILSVVAGLRSKGAYDPNPADALRKANLRVLPNSRSNVPRYVVFITKSMRDETNVIKQANKIKMRGVKVMGIGIDLSSSDQEFMKSAVSMPPNRFMHLTDSVDGLAAISDSFMSFLCNENDPCSDNPCKHSGECVSAHGDYYCKCPKGYAGKHCDISCPAKADIAFVLDASGSVGAQNFRRVKHFVTKVIDELAIGYDVARVGAVSYSSRSYMGFYMDEFHTKEEISNAIASLGYEYGNTNTAAGLRMARTRILTEKKGDRANVKNFVVVVTDSISNVNQEKTLPEAQKLKDTGAHVFSVGIGSFDPYELRAMASEPADSNTFVFNDFVSLANFSQTFVRATCVEESVLCNINKCKNGGVCVPGVNSFSCKCPRGFNGPTCAMECISKKDIVFVLDSSSSVGKDNYQTMLDFVKALVDELAGASFNNRFGMIVYSTEVRLIFSPGRYRDAATIGNAVGGTRYYPGSTNTAGGLRTALEILTNAYGARRDADDVVILITDGYSNVNSHDTIPAAEELKSTGARVLTIAVGLSDYSEVSQIASTPEDVFKVSSYNLLHDIKHDILDSSCSNNGYTGK